MAKLLLYLIKEAPFFYAALFFTILNFLYMASAPMSVSTWAESVLRRASQR